MRCGSMETRLADISTENQPLTKRPPLADRDIDCLTSLVLLILKALNSFIFLLCGWLFLSTQSALFQPYCLSDTFIAFDVFSGEAISITLPTTVTSVRPS
ncbi:hypothetical protein O181_056478 [Austropuccinia psidii MF-1]|uniref:Uncharacterized protein n=1 Tax=Austropuccinia psidii MF-1 TaxID=1389203 RepID=A0A9Q3ED63_9BASI|nr:hypothetical protein [Austropuccinia psidii MF-1]